MASDSEYPSGPGINVSIDLGPVDANLDQKKRLLAHVGNHVLSWVKADVQTETVPVTTIEGNASWSNTTEENGGFTITGGE